MLVIDWSVLPPLVELSNTRCKLLGRRGTPSKSNGKLQNAHRILCSIHCERVCAVRPRRSKVAGVWMALLWIKKINAKPTLAPELSRNLLHAAQRSQPSLCRRKTRAQCRTTPIDLDNMLLVRPKSLDN